jgi:hypothetical protein
MTSTVKKKKQQESNSLTPKMSHSHSMKGVVYEHVHVHSRRSLSMLYEIISSSLLLRYTQVQIASPELCVKQCKYVVPSDSNTMFETRKKQSVYLVLLWFYTCTCWQGMGMWKIRKRTAARCELLYKCSCNEDKNPC